jgi:pantoate--beta-alanine ligase
MEIIRKLQDMQSRAVDMHQQGKTIAFVPTMGFLHKGHLSLMREGRKRGDILVVSIFVNPAQFGPNEDFDKYPKSFEQDADAAKKEGVDILFNPCKEELYPERYQTYVNVEKLQNYLCGVSRPLHFRGVATVVTKLFNIVKADAAIFGEKDYQQLVVIRQMALDLNLDIEIKGCPIVREPDGVAMSSRNSYLSEKDRKSAVCLYQALNEAKKLVKEGVKKSSEIIMTASALIRSYPGTEIDYISIFDPETLEEIESVEELSRMAMAVRFGNTRLIDNILIDPRKKGSRA